MSDPKRLKPGQTKTAQPRDPNTPLTRVEKLAMLNRYLFPIVAVLGPVAVCLLLKADVLIPLGIGCYIFGAYQLIGYKNRWDHIYCSIQLLPQPCPSHSSSWVPSPCCSAPTVNKRKTPSVLICRGHVVSITMHQ